MGVLNTALAVAVAAELQTNAQWPLERSIEFPWLWSILGLENADVTVQFLIRVPSAGSRDSDLDLKVEQSSQSPINT
jgi:hypothetical protein